MDNSNFLDATACNILPIKATQKQQNIQIQGTSIQPGQILDFFRNGYGVNSSIVTPMTTFNQFNELYTNKMHVIKQHAEALADEHLAYMGLSAQRDTKELLWTLSRVANTYVVIVNKIHRLVNDVQDAIRQGYQFSSPDEQKLLEALYLIGDKSDDTGESYNRGLEILRELGILSATDTNFMQTLHFQPANKWRNILKSVFSHNKIQRDNSALDETPESLALKAFLKETMLNFLAHYQPPKPTYYNNVSDTAHAIGVNVITLVENIGNAPVAFVIPWSEQYMLSASTQDGHTTLETPSVTTSALSQSQQAKGLLSTLIPRDEQRDSDIARDVSVGAKLMTHIVLADINDPYKFPKTMREAEKQVVADSARTKYADVIKDATNALQRAFDMRPSSRGAWAHTRRRIADSIKTTGKIQCKDLETMKDTVRQSQGIDELDANQADVAILAELLYNVTQGALNIHIAKTLARYILSHHDDPQKSQEFLRKHPEIFSVLDCP